MPNLTDVLVIKSTPEMIHHWGWFVALGVVLIVLGIAAIARTIASTLVSMVFFGWVFAGIVEFINAFMVGKWAGFFLHLLIALLFGVIGIVFVATPSISAEVATLVMSMFFMIGGLYLLITALWTHLPGYGWQVANGAIASVLGIMLLAQWPISGLYAVGLFVGIDLVFYGGSWISMALKAHKM